MVIFKKKKIFFLSLNEYIRTVLYESKECIHEVKVNVSANTLANNYNL